LAIVSGLLGVLLACSGPETVEPGRADHDAGKAAYDDVVLATDCELESTASEKQQRRIRKLLDSRTEADELAEIVIDYPLDESIFPPGILSPTFLWHDEDGEAAGWLVEVVFAGDSSRLNVLVPGLPPPEDEIDPDAVSETNKDYRPTAYQASARSWKPAAEVWETIRSHSVAGPAHLTFYGYRESEPERVVSRGDMTLSTSRDAVGAPIFYRDVPLIPSPTAEHIMPLPKAALPLIAWRLKDISLPGSQLVMKDIPTCANCHSFSADGATLGMDIDGPGGDKGAYAFAGIERQMVIEDEDIITWNSFPDKPEGHHTLGFMSRVSPDGQTVISTVNEEIYIANFPEIMFGQVFYLTRGILACYSRDTDEFRALPGADDPDYVHTGPVWTPDGETIIFARAKARDAFIEGRPIARYAGDANETPLQYDLYRIPFNGGRGGRPEPITGASDNGMSNSFAKVSPDGRWIVFVKCKNGQLMRPDSALWIVPVEGGEARMMRCNTDRMNSWHSFSPNGRWLVFSSKSNRPFTQMFLTHIDESGNDSPPVLIEGSTAANRAVNIPEFINIAYDDLASITVPQVDHYRPFHAGNDLLREGRFEEAVVEYEKALETTSDSRIHKNLATALMNLDRNDLALQHLRQSMELNPYNYKVCNNLAYLLSEKGRLDEAREHLDAAIRLFPNQPRAFYNRGMLSLKMSDHAAAIEDFSRAIHVAPRYADGYVGRGMVHHDLKDYGAAMSDFDRAIELRPRAPSGWYFRALVRAETGDLPGALYDVNRAREAAPPGLPQRRDIEDLRRRVLAQLDTGTQH